MNEIGSSLVAIVLVMCSVFVPAAFLPGTTGQLYKQFAITIVISVTVSGFIALTLTPAMCAVLLKHTPPRTKGFFAWFNRQVDRVTQAFGVAVDHTIKRMAIALVLLAGFLFAVYYLFHIIPTSFVPNEDQGYAMSAVIMPQAASLSRTEEITRRADDIFKSLPGVATRTVVTGYSLLDSGFKTNAATIFVTFSDFEERYKNVDTAKQQNARAILQGYFAEARKIEGAIVIPIAPPAIPGIGTTGGFEF
jgi:multidrug efflux pump